MPACLPVPASEVFTHTSSRLPRHLRLVLALDRVGAAVVIGLPLVDDHALQVLALGLLGGDFFDDGREVGVVLQSPC